MSVIGVIFDFDDTLLPDSTTKLLAAHGIPTQEFWDKAKGLVLSGYDPAQAWLKLLLDDIGPGKQLGELTNRRLVEFGAQLDNDFFPGIPELFDDLREDVSKYRDIQIEYYIISGGLQPIIDGTKLVRKGYVTAAYGCRLAGDTADGYLQVCATLRHVYREDSIFIRDQQGAKTCRYTAKASLSKSSRQLARSSYTLSEYDLCW